MGKNRKNYSHTKAKRRCYLTEIQFQTKLSHEHFCVIICLIHREKYKHTNYSEREQKEDLKIFLMQIELNEGNVLLHFIFLKYF